ncbi:hypothetical protein EWM59_19850 [Emticicia agri]|uniref:Uncharacterized protein n=2 Tax=Emticicia agri TaxID=2492393 RepID=A0A4Q5LVY0_9BACT|nr:hypothetical protein EWM59_19850 [Emticicia agri]
MQKTKDTRPEFLLIGTFHYIPDSLSCNWSDAYRKLLQYKPDQIAVEEVMPTDEASLIQNYTKNYRAVWDSLILVWVGKHINPADSIRHYTTLLSVKENPKHRLQLWKYYHLGLDMGNRNFQNYLIAQNSRQYESLIDTTKGWDKYFWTRYKRMIEDKKDSEFFKLIYPLAIKSGITYLYPTDDRITFPIQSEAYSKFAEELEGTAAMKKLENFWAEYKKAETAQLRQCNAMLAINSKEWVAKTDYGQAHILDDTHNKHYKAYADVWYQRNLSIANRIIAAARQSKAKKMAVFYGNMHIFPVKKYLEEKGYKVKLLEDI